jgi:hypothetical protein
MSYKINIVTWKTHCHEVRQLPVQHSTWRSHCYSVKCSCLSNVVNLNQYCYLKPAVIRWDKINIVTLNTRRVHSVRYSCPPNVASRCYSVRYSCPPNVPLLFGEVQLPPNVVPLLFCEEQLPVQWRINQYCYFKDSPSLGEVQLPVQCRINQYCYFKDLPSFDEVQLPVQCRMPLLFDKVQLLVQWCAKLMSLF